MKDTSNMSLEELNAEFKKTLDELEKELIALGVLREVEK